MVDRTSPAFPATSEHTLEGLTKLEYFAAAALQGVLANAGGRYDDLRGPELVDEALSLAAHMVQSLKIGA